MNYKTITFALCLGMAGTLAAQSIYPGQHAGKMKVETSAPVAIKGFDLKVAFAITCCVTPLGWHR